MCEINGPKQGVFWVIQEKLFAFPFEEGKYPEALAKSKVTYTHKKLWRIVCPKGCGKPYHYYPRGRVHIAKDGSVPSLSQSAHYRRIRDGNQSIFRYRRRPQNTL